MYACLAVTCHLHFWQNDRDFLRATVVTRGWNGYRNKSQHRKSTLEKKILPPFQQGFEPATFQSRVRRSNHWAIPAPMATLACNLFICHTHNGIFDRCFCKGDKWLSPSAGNNSQNTWTLALSWLARDISNFAWLSSVLWFASSYQFGQPYFKVIVVSEMWKWGLYYFLTCMKNFVQPICVILRWLGGRQGIQIQELTAWQPSFTLQRRRSESIKAMRKGRRPSLKISCGSCGSLLWTCCFLVLRSWRSQSAWDVNVCCWLVNLWSHTSHAPECPLAGVKTLTRTV